MKTILFLFLTLALAVGASRGLAQPVITQQPQNQTNILGSNVTFTVAATGTPPLNYQWRYYLTASSFTNLPGAVEPSLTLTNIQPVAGRFAVAVGNAGGTNVSRLAVLTVLLPATILTQPTNLTLFSASHATFSPAVTGAAPVRLQWFFNQTPLPGKTNSSLTVLNVQFTNQGAYTLVASNFLGAVTSEVATLTLIIPTNGQNIKLGDKPPGLPASQRAQAEPHLMRSFSDPNLVVATFQEGRLTDGGALGCGYAISHDGGLTWSRGLIPGLTTLNDGPYERATDPVAAIDHLGNIYLSTIASFPGIRSVFFINKSTNGGASFANPVTVLTNNSSLNFAIDKQWLAANTFLGTPTVGRLFLAWTLYTPTNNYDTGGWIGVSHSDDEGRTWTAQRFIGPPVTQGMQPMFLPDGSLALIYFNYDTMQIELLYSEDGGDHFSNPMPVAPVEFYDDPTARNHSELPAATTDRMAGAIYVTWQGRQGGNSNGSPGIFFTKSIDKGGTWSNPVVVNDTPNQGGVFDPGIGVSADGQHVSVIFYDKRNDLGQGFFVDLYLAESFNGGQTWEPNVRLSEVSTDLRTAPLTGTGYMLGDYQAVVPALDFDTPAVACWIDGRSGSPDPYVIRFDRRRGTTFETWQRLRFSTNELSDLAISGPEADPDGDGIRNLAEYAHGLEPRHPDAAPLRFDSSIVIPGDAEPRPALSISFDSVSVLDDVAFSWVASGDLISWSPANPTERQSSASATRMIHTVEAKFLIGQETMNAFRLRMDPIRGGR